MTTQERVENLVKARAVKAANDVQRRIDAEHGKLAFAAWCREERRLYEAKLEAREAHGSFSQQYQAAAQEQVMHWHEMPKWAASRLGDAA